MTIYQKILSVFNLVNSLIGRRAARSELAGTFSASKTYVVGALVVYEDQLYCCTADHTGTWNLSHFSKATVNDALALKSGNGSGGHDIAVIDETLVINKGKDSGDSGSGGSGSGDSGSGDSGSGGSGSGGTVDLSGYYTSEQTDTLLDKEVDKVDGKQLTTVDFTTALSEKLSKLEPVNLTGYVTDHDLSEELSAYPTNTALKKTLSSYVLDDDLTTSLKTYVKNSYLESNYLTSDEVATGYVAKESGYGLSKNDFTDELAKKVESIPSSFVTKSDITEAVSQKADLDDSGKVPADQLPSFVDDVLEYNNKDQFPKEGEGGKIYIAIDTNMVYRWGGSVYVEVTSGGFSTGTTTGTAFDGAAGKELRDNLSSHVDCSTIHVSGTDRANWNGKADLSSVYTQEVIDSKIKTLATSDALTGISSTVAEHGKALDNKVDKVLMSQTDEETRYKVLSANDFTDEFKSKLDGINIDAYYEKTEIDETLGSYAKADTVTALSSTVSDLSNAVGSANSRLEAIA